MRTASIIILLAACYITWQTTRYDPIVIHHISEAELREIHAEENAWHQSRLMPAENMDELIRITSIEESESVPLTDAERARITGW